MIWIYMSGSPMAIMSPLIGEQGMANIIPILKLMGQKDIPLIAANLWPGALM